MPELNPVLVKELRGRMRGARAFVVLSVYLLILSLVALLLYLAIYNTSGSNLNAGQEIGKALFLVITTVALIEVCMITPALTAGSIASEKERQTYDLLIASLLSPWQIVWGKLGSALAFALLLILSIVPIMSLSFLFGGVSMTEVLVALVGLLMTAVLYAAVGLFWSSLMRSTLAATSFSLGSIILALLGVPFLVVIFLMIFTPTNPKWMESPTFIYSGGAFISTHPFIALGLTEAQLSSGEPLFFFTIHPSSTVDLLVPGPWLVYTVLALIFSIALIFLTVGRLRPIQYPQQTKAAREQQVGSD